MQFLSKVDKLHFDQARIQNQQAKVKRDNYFMLSVSLIFVNLWEFSGK